MPKVPLTLSNLGELDPKLDAAVKLELEKLTADIQDRPSEKAARVLKFELSLRPVGDSGVVDSVDARFKIESKVPPKTSRTHSLEPHGNGNLFFNPASPDDVHQGTLNDLPQAR